GPRARQLEDLGGGETGHLDAGQIGDGAAVIARPARLDELEPRAREEGFRIRLQAALRRHRDHEWRAHGAPRNAASRSIQTANPTAEIARGLPTPLTNSSYRPPPTPPPLPRPPRP